MLHHPYSFLQLIFFRCHVMERESFECEETGALLNSLFVPVKVDREERPDVDKLYMTFVQSISGSGGWPMSVFLTPTLRLSTKLFSKSIRLLGYAKLG